MEAGEVWWVQCDERRPVVLVAADDSGLRGIQLVAASGVDLAGLGVEISVGGTEQLPLGGVVRIGFPRPGYHPCTWLTALRGEDLLERAGRVSSAELIKINQELTGAEQLQDWSPQDYARFKQIRDAAMRSAQPG